MSKPAHRNTPNITVPKDAIADFCERHHIRKLSLFGSVLRDDFGPESDIDILVEFEPGHVPGFFGLVAMQEELKAILGSHPIDLVTSGFLNRRIRDRVLESAVAIYAEG